jgi:hypothetical protein
MWRSGESPPLLHATFGTITVKSRHRRRLIFEGTTRQPQNGHRVQEPLTSGFSSDESREEGSWEVPRRGRIASGVDVVSK